jgi:sugar lactone lactonase YvrE
VATSTELYTPHGVAVDSSGNIYIADNGNNRVRKVSAGIIITVAGNGTGLYSGDSGAATSAELYGPSGVAVDSSGNIYIADTYNERIRKVSTSGIITTVAGNGAATFSGDGGAATSAELHGPSGVAVDSSGNIYIADTYNERIRKVSTSGIITTVAGNGTGGYSGDGGAATSAELYYPSGVAVDSSGNIYIADRNNDRIREVSTSGIITTVAGNGTWGYSGDSGAATSAELYGPSGVAVDSSGNIFFVEDGNNRVRKVSASGIITTVAGNGTGGYSGDGGVATSAELYTPYGVAVDSSGNIYIADLNNNRIRKVFH